MPANHRRAAFAVLLASVLFSTGGAAIKWADFSGWQIASLRSGIASLTLLILLPDARRGWGWRPFVVGLAYAVTCICFVLATRLTTSANAIFIQATSPLYVLVLGPLLLRERTSRRDMLTMVPIAIGLWLFLSGPTEGGKTAPDPATGNLIAALSGLSFAFAMVGFRWLGRSGNREATPVTAATIGNFIACVAVLPLALPIGGHSGRDWAALIYLGVFQIGIAYALVGRALSRVSAMEASLLLMLEPVLNPIWSWLVHGEVPSARALLGATLVLGATLARSAVSSEEAQT
ncbi:MAG: EamA family transporter [Gemmatimonadales bacterium]|nr:EamA family transporter [Gemmatimonadales bacterium]